MWSRKKTTVLSNEKADPFDIRFDHPERKRQIMTLDQMKPGSRGRIRRLSLRDKLGQRLLDMGIYPGLQFKVIRNAPLQDPMEVELEGYFISLRHDEARHVEIE
jgi:ferrous iron transport protein A